MAHRKVLRLALKSDLPFATRCFAVASSSANTAPVRFVEVWAHKRPYFTSHQLHFDTAKEGLGLRPVCSTVAYLTGEGGPTLITQHTRGEGVVKGGFVVEPR